MYKKFGVIKYFTKNKFLIFDSIQRKKKEGWNESSSNNPNISLKNKLSRMTASGKDLTFRIGNNLSTYKNLTN